MDNQKNHKPNGQFAVGNQASKGKGRPVGSRNAITQDMLNRLVKKFEEDDTNPVEGMYALLKDPEANPELKFRIYDKLMMYTNNPAFITTDENGEAELSHADIEARIAELEAKKD
ncbi:hypothetical protein BCU39_008345 [Vibrio cyclitrophicus]|uniref:hypothetical protein n=1 Tax=Vibrio cyclitrophicus TaxID=47951 RepID=UPI000C83FEF3|nr:hypothetical protein [Vibrio cyclitrophicus]PMI70285.1 hypothetical protein BCU39_04985 [Vibrio cyclitrophicus]